MCTADRYYDRNRDRLDTVDSLGTTRVDRRTPTARHHARRQPYVSTITTFPPAIFIAFPPAGAGVPAIGASPLPHGSNRNPFELRRENILCLLLQP